MNIQESALDYMNWMAADVIECPSCSSDRMEFKSLNMDEITLDITEVWRCADCGVKQVTTTEG